jgi:hypothetical protein
MKEGKEATEFFRNQGFSPVGTPAPRFAQVLCRSLGEIEFLINWEAIIRDTSRVAQSV